MANLARSFDEARIVVDAFIASMPRKSWGMNCSKCDKVFSKRKLTVVHVGHQLFLCPRCYLRRMARVK